MKAKQTPEQTADRMAKFMKDTYRQGARAVANATIGDAVLELAARREQPSIDAIIQLLLSGEPMTRDLGAEARKIAAQVLDEAGSGMCVPALISASQRRVRG